ncbi:MAG: aldose 1-epimerase [Steroidobacteraceae bacterium]
MTTNGGQLDLASGAWELEVQPARGGAVTALRHAGRPVLVSPDPETADAIGAACFAMVPYANRIAQGRISHLGRHWALPPNFGNAVHPLHGTGWKRPWAVAAHTAGLVELHLQHSADEHWPWAYSARQRVSLLAERVRFELAVTNTSPGPAPMGIGFHPAFPACAATTLHTRLQGVWLIDADSLPVSHAAAAEVLTELPYAAPALRSILVDHCFTGWSRELRIENAGTAGELAMVEMRASPEMDFLQLYTPPGRNWFCAEPMSQMPDAINRQAGPHDTGLRILAPGESLQAWMTIAVHDSRPGA